MNRKLKLLLTFMILLISLIIITFIFAGRFFVDLLWFKNLNFSQAFMKMFFSNIFLRILLWLIFSLVIYINLSIAKKIVLRNITKKAANVESLFGSGKHVFSWLNKKRINFILAAFSLLIAFVFSSIGDDFWRIVLEYINQTPFDYTDPVFNKDIAFYVFILPFYNFIKEMGMILLLLNIIIVSFIYTISSGVKSFNDFKFKFLNSGKVHITILVIIFLLLKAWDYRLSMYNLLYSPRGIFFGAGYTDIHANLLGLKILFFVVIVLAIFVMINLFRKSYSYILSGLAVWLLISLIFTSIYPGLIQKYRVEPNEIVLESEYISYNIEMTLKAYGLDKIVEKEFEIKNDLNGDILKEYSGTIENVRLWDTKPLLSTYNQLQGLRPYYSFVDVDVDRYLINGKYQQVMLSARELDQRLLNPQAQNWINQKLKYTHGYGIVMSPVNKATTNGLPEFLLKDIPTKNFTDVYLENSSIYYGERTNEDYVIVNNRSGEFHYPLGSENEYTDYDGKGGVQLSNFLRNALYAVHFGNLKILLSNDIKNESRIMYYRNISQRVRKVAPYLRYDNDPYLVIFEGRLFWIQDAYTTTDRFPYSKPTANLGNYIRNSIKVVIDAYNGTMDFYVIDKNDPLAQTYMKIFPDVFKDGDLIPHELSEHFRYPEDLFKIQAELYTTYHMKDPVVFYNREDQWNIPQENYGGSIVQMEPYYVNMVLPGYDETEFVLMLPFTPANKNNMISWIAGRSDDEHYGELIVYNFPKDQLVYGPMQIESRIEQNAEISQLLTLWGQRGSRVIRGDLLVLPIGNSILYIEPVYLQAETSELPELKRVVVAYQDKIVMEENLEEALRILINGEGVKIRPESSEEEIETDDKIDKNNKQDFQELLSRALEKYLSAQENIKAGNWAGFGEDLNELGDILTKLNEME